MDETRDALTELEIDALKELFNIGLGRAAQSLNRMVSETVELSVPQVSILPSAIAAERLRAENTGTVSAVSQRFVGDFTGQAILLFSKDRGLLLVRKLLGNTVPLEYLSELEQDSLVEIGNIILNACFGTVINFLKSDIEIEMPMFEQGAVGDILDYSSERDWSLYIEVRFSLPSDDINGFISFLMDIESLEVFKKSVRDFVSGIHAGL